MKKNKQWVSKRILSFDYKGERRTLGWNTNTYREWFRYSQLSGKYPKEFGDLSKYGTEQRFMDIHSRYSDFQVNYGGKPKGRKNKNGDKEFKKWWDDKKYLFIEPLQPPVINENISNKPNTNNNFIKRLELDFSDIDKLKFEMKHYIEQQERILPKYVFKSQSQFHPSINQQSIQLSKLMLYRRTWELRYIKKLSRVDTFLELFDLGLVTSVVTKEDGTPEKSLKRFEQERELYKDKDKMNTEKSHYSDVRVFEWFGEEVKRVSYFIYKVNKTFKNIEKGTFP